ncbi:lipocalin family protein [Dongshaea marina]|uniref:lipocalin family protein n=1 Tax=Dongshaea marina TaxID=2047966 RepID=UPI000D3E2529|nr:lipocalin family protein [Dongshaea marina]
MKKSLVIACSLFVTGCTGIPKGVQPVKHFELSKYLGTWYEIARLDHTFERGLSNVTAQYSMRDDGGVKVVNRGFSKEKNKWKEAVGKAYFADGQSNGYLKVSFFGPFYGSYIIFGLDHKDYQYAFVSGPSKEYLWLLARSPRINPVIIENFVQMAKDRGCLFYTSQEQGNFLSIE